MQIQKNNIKNLLVNISLLIYAAIVLIRPYLKKILGSNIMILALLFISIIILLMSIMLTNKIKVKNFRYIMLCIFMSIPLFYKNAYIEDGYYYNIYYFMGTIMFCIILSFIKIGEDNINFIMKIFITFAIITSLVTWFSLIFPKAYDSIFISMLPYEDQLMVRNHFWNSGMKMGLTNHYSRNAFYLLLGIIGCIVKNRNKKNSILICLFFVTLLLVGKRAHFLFLLVSLFVAYLIYEKNSFKKMLSMSKYITLVIIVIAVAIIFIPGTSTIFERIFNTSGGDISTGRFELYDRIWNLFVNNSYSPIGWGQFSKSTNYFFAGVHNDYLQLLCETGVLGLSLILFSNLYILGKSIFIIRKDKENLIIFGMLIYQIFYLIYSATGLPHYEIETYMVYFIFSCFVFSNFRYKEKKYVK